MLLLKLALAPSLILVASLAGRRWGPLVAGWIAGFPLTSGPVSIFLAVEQDLAFAAAAAEATLVGVVAMLGFCLAYAAVAPRLGIAGSLAGATAAMVAAAALLLVAEPGLPETLLLLLVVIGLGLALLPRAAAKAATAPPPWWDIPARMAVAAGLVVGLTESAYLLGPNLSGLISPVPVFASVLAVFTHREQGGREAAELLRGVVLGALSFSSFFLVVALALEAAGLLPAYALATLASAAVNIGVLALDRRLSLHRPS